MLLGPVGKKSRPSDGTGARQVLISQSNPVHPGTVSPLVPSLICVLRKAGRACLPRALLKFPLEMLKFHQVPRLWLSHRRGRGSTMREAVIFTGNRKSAGDRVTCCSSVSLRGRGRWRSVAGGGPAEWAGPEGCVLAPGPYLYGQALSSGGV